MSTGEASNGVAAAEVAARTRWLRRGADAILREHPDALIYALAADGMIAPVPEEFGLSGRELEVADCRSGLDYVVSDDRMPAVHAWMRVKEDAAAETAVRYVTDPAQWMTLHMIDLRSTHGIVLCFAWPSENGGEGQAGDDEDPQQQAAPRFATRRQDQEGKVVGCDDAYLRMFGYGSDEVLGKPTFEQVHPDDQARVIEGWIATVATGRVQMLRVRMKRGDGTWLWVDTTLHNYLADADRGYVLAECIDVSAEMAAQEALQEREELLRHLLEEMPDGLLQLDRESNVVFHNRRLVEILLEGGQPVAGDGEHAEAERTVALAELLSTVVEHDTELLAGALERSLADGEREDVEIALAAPGGEERNALLKIRPLHRTSGEVTGLIASVLDVTENARARRELEHRASFDALTGLPNRTAILAAIEQELRRSDDLAVLYIDLDGFKGVNDTFGHAAGDEVLAAVAARLQGAMRASDEVGRLGGDEFVVLLRDVTSLELAMGAARRVSGSVAGPLELACATVDVQASIGVACAEQGDRAEPLIQRADQAMYRSKAQRRGIPMLAA